VIETDWLTFLRAVGCEPYTATWAGWSTEVPTHCVTWSAIHPKRTTAEWRERWHDEYGKPIVRSLAGLERSTPEIEVVEAFRRTGWGARWPDSWGKAPAWMSPWKRAEVPKALSAVIAGIRAASPKAKPWDAIAWRDGEYLFVECKGPKGRGREPFTDGELAFIWGAWKSSVPMTRFAVLYGDIVYPEREPA
jgi:hypothetical protein